LDYWLGDPPVFAPPLGVGKPLHALAAKGWSIYPETGQAVCDSGFWWLRWDLSPLGYLKTAAHGHLDALHLSMWFNGVAVIIDPGTGAYYADKDLRSWLASRNAHNGPCPTGEEYPKRLGPFLWAEHHLPPTWNAGKIAEVVTEGLVGEFSIPGGILRRCITRVELGDGWQVEDEFAAKPGFSGEFSVRWQFGPGAWIRRLEERVFSVNRAEACVRVDVGKDWAEVNLVEQGSERDGRSTTQKTALEGVISPAFRKAVFAPYLKLTARSREKSCVFRTTFLASSPS
jgi:hypothetical protein